MDLLDRIRDDLTKWAGFGSIAPSESDLGRSHQVGQIRVASVRSVGVLFTYILDAEANIQVEEATQ